MKCKEDGKEYGPIIALKGGEHDEPPKTPNGKGTTPINANKTELYNYKNYDKI